MIKGRVSQNGINISSSDVTLDLNGFTLFGGPALSMAF